MSFDDDSDIVSSGAQEDSGFAEYAVENWDVHLANLSGETFTYSLFWSHSDLPYV